MISKGEKSVRGAVLLVSNATRVEKSEGNSAKRNITVNRPMAARKSDISSHDFYTVWGHMSNI